MATKYTVGPREFREYIEDKYKGKVVKHPVKQFIERPVETISDLALEHLDLTDQRMALDPTYGWAWGFGDGKDLESSKNFRGFLFRPTQRKWWWNFSRYVALFGGFGSAKSASICLWMINMMTMYPGCEILLMRVTITQLLDTTLSTLFKMFQYFGWREGEHWSHHITRKEVRLKVGEKVSVVKYRPAKNESGNIQEVIDDLLSLEPDMIMFDEPVGIFQEIFDAAALRVGRGYAITNEQHRQLRVAGNPPSKNHYLYKYFDEKVNPATNHELEDPDSYAVYYASSLENRGALTDEYIKALHNMPEDKKRTFLYGEPGYVEHEGVSVYPNFYYDLVVNEHLSYNPKKPIIVGIDGSPTARRKAAVAMQSEGLVMKVLAEFLTSDPGIKAFGTAFLEEFNQLFPGIPGYIFYGDPALFEKSETDLMTPAMILAQLGIGIIAGAKHFSVRKDAVSSYLDRMVNGRSGLQVHPRCRLIIEGFNGGYAYKEYDPNSGREATNPIKNYFSDVHDALQYPLTKIVGVNTEGHKEIDAKLKRKNAELRSRHNRVGALKGNKYKSKYQRAERTSKPPRPSRHYMYD